MKKKKSSYILELDNNQHSQFLAGQKSCRNGIAPISRPEWKRNKQTKGMIRQM